KPLNVAPVAPVVLYVIVVIGVFKHTVCASVPAADVSVMVLFGVTVIVPLAVITPQPPVSVTVSGHEPVTVGVPLIVTTLAAHGPVTPAGRPVKVAPVAPVVPYVMLAIAVLIQTVCASVPAADVSVMVLFGVTVIVPLAVITPQPPVSVTVYGNEPDTVGVPLIVTTLAAHDPVTPAGKPLNVAPVAPVVPYVILVIAVLIQTVCASVPAADVSV